MKNRLLSVVVVLILVAMSEGVMAEERGFAEDVEFLKRHVETIVLGEEGGPQVAVVPAYQGRVITSTVGVAGDGKSAAPSFGWINYELIESGKQVPHIHVFGGEERFWLGPEGGSTAFSFRRAGSSSWPIGRHQR
jgi:hypothetical protein